MDNGLGILNFFKGSYEYTHSANYRNDEKDTARGFNYAEVDNPKQSYGYAINNLIKAGAELVIRTNANMSFKINGLVTTQDGKLCTISTIQKISDTNSQVYRVLKVSANEEYIIGLLEVENPKSIK